MDITTFYDLGDEEVETNVVKYLQQQKYPALVCDKNTLLFDAMLKICSKRSHRIWDFQFVLHFKCLFPPSFSTEPSLTEILSRARYTKRTTNFRMLPVFSVRFTF